MIAYMEYPMRGEEFDDLIVEHEKKVVILKNFPKAKLTFDPITVTPRSWAEHRYLKGIENGNEDEEF